MSPAPDSVDEPIEDAPIEDAPIEEAPIDDVPAEAASQGDELSAADLADLPSPDDELPPPE